MDRKTLSLVLFFMVPVWYVAMEFWRGHKSRLHSGTLDIQIIQIIGVWIFLGLAWYFLKF